ncbi:hypothetical protein CABS01_06665 [Colletotrichum abscissum]|uniref:Uncharacterized protein n=1 Tax=Colletotrichum abscissum TaxID=1671311 RepID=A0A9Q0B678_9PEZI|nr:uncharacterized protein CABS01_06665 [Colletotrichum abscissum]KAI3554688.1 hypothetical protein CABS02_05169 [Colletotrichum abscissum]KAK1514686.1 hypothetical protein CABS01_06665 [Colletotrichum abscissum]
MSLNQPTPLLLTKRLTSFLASNLNANLHTALLATPSGRLLAHASPQPVSLLRTQSTVASSLFALHASATPDIPDALPSSSSTPPSSSGAAAANTEDGGYHAGGAGGKPLTITVQLAAGVVVIRRLKCGLLFVCIGPLAETIEAQQASSSTDQHSHSHHSSHANAGANGGAGTGTPFQIPASPSEADSILSLGAQTTTSLASVGSVNTAGVVVLRRHAEELARWLDDKLGSLRVPEEGVGVE